MTDVLPHVLVLAGGLSHERDISLRSGRRVSEALRSAGFSVSQTDLGADLLARLRSASSDHEQVVVFPLVHGVNGEDGALREVLELAGVPYVGARPDACRAVFDKPVAQDIVAAAGVATPRTVVLGHETFRELGAKPLMAALIERVGLPLAVKPDRGGSALGFSVVTDPSQLATAMVQCFAYAPVAIVQQFIRGAELAVTVVQDSSDEPRALPPVEIRPDSGVYDYAARYTPGVTRFLAPAKISDEIAQRAAQAAIASFAALRLRDIGRADLIADESGTLWFLEQNVAPGMTETSLVPLAAQADGVGFTDLCARLVMRAANRGAKA